MTNDIVTKNGIVAGQWNGQNVEELKQIMSQARKKLDRGDRFVVEGTPHREAMPDLIRNFTAYLIWAIDSHGMCLVGSGANRFESLATIDEFYGNDIAQDAVARHSPEG